MIEEKSSRLPFWQRVRIPHLDVSGNIYEMGTADSGHTIYGVQLDSVVWAGGLCTIVWHCRREELVELSALRVGSK